MRFEVQAECPITRARAGVLHTDHGSIPTPIFMPVGHAGDRKGVTPQQLLDEVDPPIILSTRTTCTSGPATKRFELSGDCTGSWTGRARS